MRKPIFTVALAAALFVSDQAIASAEELSPEVKAQLCIEKKAGLAKLEAEAPGLHAQVAKLKSEYDAASLAETEAMDRAGDRIRTGDTGFVGDNVDKGAFALFGAATLVRQAKQRELDSAKERERYVGSQIFLLRDIVEGLRCDTPTPPVDYNAIEQHTQQYQQSQPGSQTTTSSQSVQPQGSYATPSSGFGPSGSTQSSGPQGQQPGYGPGPYGTGPPSVNWQGLVPPSSPGGSEGHSHPSGGG